MSVAKSASREQALLTIGAVCEQLKGDFPDISISKIRYLEDQGLIAPRRTRGGYRLFGEDDVERLRRILAPAARRVPAAPGDPTGALDAVREGSEAQAGGDALRPRGRLRPRRAVRADRHLGRPGARAGGVRAAAPRGPRRGRSVTRRPTRGSRSRAGASPTTGSAPGTFGPFERPPTARRACSRRSSRRRSARGTPSAVRKGCASSRRSPRRRRSWPSSCSSAI